MQAYALYSLGVLSSSHRFFMFTAYHAGLRFIFFGSSLKFTSFLHVYSISCRPTLYILWEFSQVHIVSSCLQHIMQAYALYSLGVLQSSHRFFMFTAYHAGLRFIFFGSSPKFTSFLHVYSISCRP